MRKRALATVQSVITFTGRDPTWEDLSELLFVKYCTDEITNVSTICDPRKKKGEYTNSLYKTLL